MTRRWAVVAAFAALLGAFSLLCRQARQTYSNLEPSFEACLNEPERFDGREVRGYPFHVAAIRKDGFVACQERVKMFVTPRPPDVREGDWVGLVGDFRRGGFVEARTVTRLPHYREKRAAMYAVSLAALAFVAVVFLKSFRLNAADGWIRSA